MRGLSLPIVGLVLALLLGCHDSGSSADYVRIEGPSPALADKPKARSLLVVFWATWCPPCREETPQLRSLAENPPEGMRVVVVSQDDEIRAVEAFLGGVPDSSLHLRIDAGKRLFGLFGVEQLPAAFLVVDGQLRARFEGPRQWDGKTMRALLERLIVEPEERA
ncbi:MAG TPA: TlpA disulfide reductase family protein [Terriglobales bacterium]|nr:TlpA disulfide reductase family protein [Terriglobales bacterium]